MARNRNVFHKWRGFFDFSKLEGFKVSEYNSDRVKSEEIQEWMLREMVAAWQEDHGLIADGLCGPATQQALFDARETTLEIDCSELHKAALQEARRCIGQGEVGGNNSGEFVEALLGKEYDGDDDDDGAWCAAFMSHCFEVAAERCGVDLPFATSFGAKALFRKVKNAGTSDFTPKPGDLVCWDRGKRNPDGSKSWQGHVGIVERVENGIFHTIEGNRGGFPSKVRRFKYHLATDERLEGFARVG